ncbi:MAG: hypothetical protein IPJ47_22930 [Anaerolineales bacterium]|nr:hypothetical protein [Anaerolineales bacterium]
MLNAGASGYVPKRAALEELITAIRAAAMGKPIFIRPWQNCWCAIISTWTAQAPGRR